MPAEDAAAAAGGVTGVSSAGHPDVIVRFGPFEAHLRSGELFRDGVRQPLQRQPFRLLQALALRRGELVTRDELRRLLWGDDTFVAFERGLTSAVRKVREALGDRAETPLFIETLPGRGYRFVAATRVEPRIAPPATASAVSPARPGVRTAIAAAAVLMLLVAGRDGQPAPFTQRLAAAERLSKQACDLKARGRFDEGLALMRRAHDLAPESAKITAELGLHLHAARQYEAELPTLLRAVSLDQYSADAWLHLGLGYARRSDFAAAIPALERAAALEPRGERIQSWLQWARAQRS
jgi:DNA-binding winged helix-turn-helix (wHTH) protein